MPLRRSASFLARWTHTFVSVAGFGALIFFSFTGITLNHYEFFESGEPEEVEFEGEVPLEWCAPGEATGVKRLELVEALRDEAGVRGRVKEFEIEESEILIAFETAGSSTSAYVDRETGAYEGTAFIDGFWVLANNLHKGRGTGAAWSWVIDLSAAVLLVCGLTGLWLLWYVKRRRRSGLVVTAIGVVVLPLVYVLYEMG